DASRHQHHVADRVDAKRSVAAVGSRRYVLRPPPGPKHSGGDGVDRERSVGARNSGAKPSLADGRNETSAGRRKLREVNGVRPGHTSVERRLDVDVGSDRSAASEREPLLELQEHGRAVASGFTELVRRPSESASGRDDRVVQNHHWAASYGAG